MNSYPKKEVSNMKDIISFTRRLFTATVLITTTLYLLPFWTPNLVNYIAQDLGNNWARIYAVKMLPFVLSSLGLYIAVVILSFVFKGIQRVYQELLILNRKRKHNIEIQKIKTGQLK
jgi:hypothetical protein